MYMRRTVCCHASSFTAAVCTRYMYVPIFSIYVVHVYVSLYSIPRFWLHPLCESTVKESPPRLLVLSARRKGKRVSSVMEGGQEVLKRESMGRRFKGELRDLVERIDSTEVCFCVDVFVITYTRPA